MRKSCVCFRPGALFPAIAAHMWNWVVLNSAEAWRPFMLTEWVDDAPIRRILANCSPGCAGTYLSSQRLKSWDRRMKSSRSSLVTQLSLRSAWASWEQSSCQVCHLPGCQSWFGWSNWLGRCHPPYHTTYLSSHRFSVERIVFGQRSSYCCRAPLTEPSVRFSWACLTLTHPGALQLR